ncbi:MAG: DUF4097 domain-containing protein [Planctomycetes bacterium]|jgi:DUF4097 and DUF4098 domain-containing protein YvlB|nr:DUF4097 domain-containing protein [Planctomycetota bacterium]
MKSCYLWFHAVFGISVLPFATFSGCNIQLGSSNQAKYERTVSRELAAITATNLDVDTSSGSIKVTGTDGNEASITALIVARALTEAEAQDLAEQVEIRSDTDAETLKIRADTPDLTNNRSISVSYTITVPRRMSVLALSHYGSLDIANMNGAVKGKTSSGSIEAQTIGGSLDLDTSYGSITCRSIAGPATLLRSSSGSITVADLKGSAKILTSYGSIICRDSGGPELDLKSSSGSITLTNTPFAHCVAQTSYGSVNCTGFKGNALKLHSNTGGVTLADTQADTIDLHTSYGRVEARQVTTANLLAQSGSGSIGIVCSASCPPDLKATAKASYGSIVFQAPPQFAGEVRLSTSHGSVHTALPVTLTGAISKKSVTGRIGEGAGSLDLESGSGSIELK